VTISKMTWQNNNHLNHSILTFNFKKKS